MESAVQAQQSLYRVLCVAVEACLCCVNLPSVALVQTDSSTAAVVTKLSVLGPRQALATALIAAPVVCLSAMAAVKIYRQVVRVRLVPMETGRLSLVGVRDK